MARRRFLAQLAAWPLAAMLPAGLATPRAARLKIMLKSAWGSDDPTKAAFPFSHGHALAEAGHDVQIFLLGEAVGLMRPVGDGGRRACRMAPGRRSAGEGCGAEDPDLRLRHLRSCPRGDRGRSGELGRELRESQDLRIAGGVGGPGDHGVDRSRSARGPHDPLHLLPDRAPTLDRVGALSRGCRRRPRDWHRSRQDAGREERASDWGGGRSGIAGGDHDRVHGHHVLLARHLERSAAAPGATPAETGLAQCGSARGAPTPARRPGREAGG